MGMSPHEIEEIYNHDRIDELLATNELLIKERNETVHELKAHLVELETENKRLRVCGNCQHFDAEEFQFCAHPETLDAGYDGDMPYYISAPDKCDFKPSRWAKRGMK